jgi:flavin reductase (DIM6/NTAB) family NADH-FMN oxidoreductase RutF
MKTDHAKLAAALGRIPSGLFILTARQGAHETGMLVSWVQQCSFEPPRISVAVKPEREINRLLAPNHLFVLNIIAADNQLRLLKHFGKGFSLDEPAFTGLSIDRPEDGPPVLHDALAHLRCQVVKRAEAGDHNLLIAEVIAGDVREGEPLVHVRKNGMKY